MTETISSNPKSFITNSIWSVSATFWGIIVAFLLTPYIVNKIGEDHYSLYMILMSVAGLLGIVNLGLGEATVRFVSLYYSRSDIDGINRVVGSTLLIYLLTGIMAGCFLFFFAENISGWLSVSNNDRELSVSIIKLTAFNFGLSFVIGVYAAIPQAILRFDVSSKIAIFQNIFQVGGTVGYLVLGYGLYHLVLWGVISVLFTQITNMIMAKRLLPGLTLFPVISRSGLREVFSYGIFSSVNGIIALISAHIDKILLAAFVNPAAVTALSIPRQILDKGGALVQSSSSVIFPKVSTMSDYKEIRKIFHISSWVMITFTMAMFTPGIVLFPKFLSAWINPEFSMKSAFVAQLLAAAYAFRGISEPYFAVLRGTNNIKKMTIILALTNLVSIVSAVPLLYFFKLYGAGYKSLIFVWLSFPISLWVNRFILHDQNTRKFLNLLLTSVWVTILVISFGALFDRSIEYSSLIYVILAWLTMSVTILIITYLVKRIFLRKTDFDITQIEAILHRFWYKIFNTNG